MAIEDFEWEGEIREDGAALPVRPARSGLWARVTQSVWVEPALRLGGMAALLGVLAGIGVVATTYAKPGLPLPSGPRALAAALGTSWLKPTPAPADSTPADSAHARGTALTTAPAATAASATAANPAPIAAPPASSSAPAPAEATPGAAPAGITVDGRVVLNVASADELTKLPGVGMKRAQAIVSLRTKLKRFKSATELLRVKGIGPRGLQRMLPHLVLDAPVASS
jgi:competence protein ComEA